VATLGNYFSFHDGRVMLTVVDPRTNATREVDMDITEAMPFLHAIKSEGVDHAHDMVAVALRLAGHDVTEQDHHQIRAAMESIKLGIHMTDEEQVLLNSYMMLTRRKWTRAQAAEFASLFLGKEISANTWQKRLDRWCDATGRSKPVIHKYPSRQTITTATIKSDNITL
jgi:hypothetical protein